MLRNHGFLRTLFLEGRSGEGSIALLESDILLIILFLRVWVEKLGLSHWWLERLIILNELYWHIAERRESPYLAIHRQELITSLAE